MTNSAARDIYFSFFMFTVNLHPTDPEYTKAIVRHMKALKKEGYTGFDLPIAAAENLSHQEEVDNYRRLREALEEAGLGEMGFSTNVAATATFDPSSDDADQRERALAYLKSRVDITKALGGRIMAGPLALPYGIFPVTDIGEQIWSDTLQDWVVSRYQNARPVIEELASHAAEQHVKVAIEPVGHWETAPPNLVGEVMDFLADIDSRQVGVCIDSAHVVLGSDGPTAFTDQVLDALAAHRLHYVHISAPDRGAVHDSWIPWKTFLKPILKSYTGPFLVEVFNALPEFVKPLRLTRGKFLIPGEDASVPGRPDAYHIARAAIATLRREIDGCQ